MSDASDRRSLLLAALALGGGAGMAEALAPALARAAGPSDPGHAPSGATTRSGVPPEQFGADGTVAGDSAGLRAALASDASAIDLEPRTYLLDASGLTRMASPRWASVAPALLERAVGARHFLADKGATLVAYWL